jgi:branched-chain amino acid transport system permease protein
LIFGLMRIPNLAHGAFFMLGAYFGYSLIVRDVNFWLAALLAGLGVGVIGVLLEGLVLHPNSLPTTRIGQLFEKYVVERLRIRSLTVLWRNLAQSSGLSGNEQGQVLVTLGVSFIIADICLLVWTGDPMTLPAPQTLRPPLRVFGFAFPTYRLVVLVIALVAAVGLYLLMERTRIGAMIRAGVDDREMARGVGIPVSRLFTMVFLLGSSLAGIGGVLGGPILNAYPGLDADMLPLALIVVILGGAGSLLGAFVGSFVVGFLYNYGIALAPDLAYFVLFLPMVLVLVFLPQGLFGRVQL